MSGKRRLLLTRVQHFLDVLLRPGSSSLSWTLPKLSHCLAPCSLSTHLQHLLEHLWRALHLGSTHFSNPTTKSSRPTLPRHQLSLREASPCRQQFPCYQAHAVVETKDRFCKGFQQHRRCTDPGGKKGSYLSACHCFLSLNSSRETVSLNWLITQTLLPSPGTFPLILA